MYAELGGGARAKTTTRAMMGAESAQAVRRKEEQIIDIITQASKYHRLYMWWARISASGEWKHRWSVNNDLRHGVMWGGTKSVVNNDRLSKVHSGFPHSIGFAIKELATKDLGDEPFWFIDR